MSNDYPVDIMTAFYAATTTVENGKLAEIEIEFYKETSDYEIRTIISIRREPRPTGIFMQSNKLEE